MILLFRLDGEEVEVQTPPDRRLLDVLREDLGRRHPKEGCGVGACGFCHVMLDDDLVCSCLVPVLKVSGRRVTTFAGLREDEVMQELEEELEGVLPEEPCREPLLMALYALLGRIERVTREDLVDALSGTACPCGAYEEIVGRARLLAGIRSRNWQDTKEGVKYRLPGI